MDGRELRIPSWAVVVLAWLTTVGALETVRLLVAALWWIGGGR